MPDLSMLASGAGSHSQLKTCLVYQTLSPLSLLDDLRGIFEVSLCHFTANKSLLTLDIPHSA